MKKALIAIISTIYVIALVIVSFLGTRAEVIDHTIYVEQIVLNNKDMYKRNAPEEPENRIVRVYKRPDASQIDEKGVGITDRVNWDYEGIHRDYAIFFEDYFYYYEMLSQKYTIETSVIPDNSTNKTLSYYMQATDKVNEMVKMTTYGEISFDNLKHTGWIDFDVIVSSTDFSDISIDVLVKVGTYN